MQITYQQASHRQRWLFYIALVVVLVVGGLLVAGSQALLFVDTNDFQRVVGHLNLTPLGDGLRWALSSQPSRTPGNPEIASHIFTFAGWVQRYLPGSVFDLARTALVAKCLLVVCACVLAWQCTQALQRGAWWFCCFALAWLAVFFMAHNIGMAQSFYAEYAFLIAFPLLLIGMLARNRGARLVCLGLGVFVCGLAKVQYFYVPLLALVCVWVASWWQRVATDKALLKLLLAIQVLCLVPMLIGKNAALNGHHGLYLGSYMVLTPAQLDKLGVPAAERACIGVDAWGNAFAGEGGTEVKRNAPTCFPETPRLSKRDVLRPYMHYPQALMGLAQYALPSHFTVHYFHVFPGNFYLKRVEGGTQAVTDLLLGMTDARERYITPMTPFFLLAALAFFAISRSRKAQALRSMAAAGLLLGLFVASQIVVAMLGEGVRDLSKHLWAAQLALDMLVLLIALQALGWLCNWRQAPTGHSQAELS